MEPRSAQKGRGTIFYSPSRLQIPANKINLPHQGLASLLSVTSRFAGLAASGASTEWRLVGTNEQIPPQVEDFIRTISGVRSGRSSVFLFRRVETLRKHIFLIQSYTRNLWGGEMISNIFLIISLYLYIHWLESVLHLSRWPRKGWQRLSDWQKSKVSSYLCITCWW